MDSFDKMMSGIGSVCKKVDSSTSSSTPSSESSAEAVVGNMTDGIEGSTGNARVIPILQNHCTALGAVATVAHFAAVVKSTSEALNANCMPQSFVAFGTVPLNFEVQMYLSSLLEVMGHYANKLSKSKASSDWCLDADELTKYETAMKDFINRLAPSLGVTLNAD